MRRGHPNVGGWRGENHRHNFRPRNPGTPHFRPSRPYLQPDTPRYPVHNPRHYRPPRPYNAGPRHANDAQPVRNPYRLNNVRMPQDGEPFTRERHKPHQNQRDQDHGNYESNIYQHSDGYHINSMGDTDHRRPHPNMQNTNTHNPWTNHQPTFEYTKQYYEERNTHKTPRRYNMSDEMPLPDYSGHRPPASDHYTGTTANNNNSQFAHSVDDTVDIVRKRLMNRDKQQEPTSPIHQSAMDEDLRREPGRNYQSPPREQPVKKKMPQRKQNIQDNCDKMKNKIVHQLFKMDKSKIHKLMDNPSSSSKFEYAISTLITEGQNSLNRHMRSVAEKSLCSSSSDFIQNDSNTIYEDTFMKQMQMVLDPQDTVLLEDIKPLVMAELSRVLQLDDFQFEGLQNQSSWANTEPSRMDYPYDESYNEQLTESHNYDQSQQDSFNYNNTDSVDSMYNRSNEESSFESKSLFERRQKHGESLEERKSIESRVSNHSLDQGDYVDKPKSPCEQPIPLFDPNTDQLSDDDYPFAELDKQYHVAVDHTFIESISCAPSPQHSLADVSNDSFNIPSKEQNEVPYKSPTNIKYEINMHLPSASSGEIEKEIDSQLQNLAQSPVKIFSKPKVVIKSENEVSIKTETKSCNKSGNEMNQKIIHDTENVIHEETIKKEKEPNHDSVHNSKSVLQPNTRKRSTDQKPSHRKEKRKKRSESECQEASKSIAMFYSSEDHKNGPNDHKKSIDKTYSNKYVKRKHVHKEKEKDPVDPKVSNSKNINSNIPSHSILSPKNSNTQDTSNKDPKIKLKHIDMFVGQPKKPGPIHLARRNTATASNVKSPDDNKPKTIVPTPPITNFYRKLSKRHISTQVVLKRRNKECQTSTPKQDVKVTQTDPVTITSKNVAINPLERMKEIDMEIQILLQEKFKLYNSIESNSKAESIDTIPSLSMRIFNVAQPEESQDPEDAIVDDFTSIPTEELEEIAMETFENSPPKEKRGRRQKVLKLERKASESPTTKRNKNTKAPNISLIEQIITDDRPIEDIISLGDFEMTPTKSSKKKNNRPRKKKGMKKNKVKRLCRYYNIKPCFILLERIDTSQYLKPKQSHKEIIVNNEFEFEVPIVGTNVNQEAPNVLDFDKDQPEPEHNEVVEDNLQFDMLDVSEDIIIGDNVEVKLDKSDEKTLTEDIILDNSQSSLEEVPTETVATETECKMYDYSTNDNLRRDAITVTGHADAVLAIECIENEFIAACLDGNVYHFNGNGVLLNTLRGSNLAVTCLTIVQEKYGTTVYTGSLDSRIRYYDLETGMEKGPECNVLSPIQTMDRAWDTVFVGTRTGFVLQFECKNNMLIPVSTVKFSEQSILALRALKEGPRKVLLVAARSENVTVRDAQTGLLLRTLDGPKMTVYTLLFEDGKVYCGTSSHSIHVFDYTSGNHVGTHEGGKGAVCLRASGGLVFAGCYDGCVYIYREGDTQPLAHLRGPSLMLLSLAIRGTKIIAGYKDRSLYIWNMPAAILQEMVL